jgi:hypothetical protein
MEQSFLLLKSARHFLTPKRRRKAELIGLGLRAVVFPAWARSRSWVGQRFMTRLMTLS